MHPGFKFRYFENKWTGSEAHYVKSGKAKVRKHWENYKQEAVAQRPQSPREAPKPLDYLADILNQVAPTTVNPTRHSTRKDQLALYLDEPLSHMGLMDYWRPREFEWPQLAKMAFDFLVVRAMSSECERVSLLARR
jgi:hypothetical protein